MTSGTASATDDVRVALDLTEHYEARDYGEPEPKPHCNFQASLGDDLDDFLESVLAESVETEESDAGGRSASPASAPEVSEGISGLTEEDLVRLSTIFRHNVAENTRINYGSQWRRFVAWARERDASVLPAEPVQVAAYLAERVEKLGHKPATLRIATAAITFVHRSVGLADPCRTESVKKTLSGATRKSGSAQRQAEGLTVDALESIRATVCSPRRGRGGNYESEDAARRRGAKDIAMISLMRDALLRVSEAATLMWKDIEKEEDGTGRLLIRRSKTDAEGESAMAFVSAPTMASLESIREGASDEDSMFGLARNQITRRIKSAAQAAGLGDGYSGHSPRVGMARDLARAGTELTRLMTAGRWRSPRMPALYTRNEIVSRGAVAQYYGSYDGHQLVRMEKSEPEGVAAGKPRDDEASDVEREERDSLRSCGHTPITTCSVIPLWAYSDRPFSLNYGSMALASHLRDAEGIIPVESKRFITAVVNLLVLGLQTMPDLLRYLTFVPLIAPAGHSFADAFPALPT